MKIFNSTDVVCVFGNDIPALRQWMKENFK